MVPPPRRGQDRPISRDSKENFVSLDKGELSLEVRAVLRNSLLIGKRGNTQWILIKSFWEKES